MLFDFRCGGLSACPRKAEGDEVADVSGAIAALRARGARSVALVGASLGGVTAVMAAAKLHPSAIVDLSGERNLGQLFPGTTFDSYAAAPDVSSPGLFVVARADPQVSVGDMRAVYGRVRSPVKRLVVLPASAGHGWDMLVRTGGVGWAPLAGEVLDFVREHDQTASSQTDSSQTTPTRIRRVDGCVPLAGDARAVTLRPPGSKALTGVMLGSGATAFVFSDESDENLCSWLPFVRTLRAHGYSALLYDYLDPSQLAADATAGAAAARAAGARRVILIGASVGARGSIKAAATGPPGVAAVVSLSAERSVSSDPSDLVRSAAHVKLPALLIGAREDPFAQGATGPLLRAMPSTHKRALVLPGVDHGTALLSGEHGRRVQSAILSFAASV